MHRQEVPNFKCSLNSGRIRSEGYDLDDVSNLTHNVRPHDFDNVVPDVDADDGCIGVIVAIVLWIVWAIVVVVALWIFSNVVLGVIFTFAAMLYWIFFRALRLVFNNSNKSKGDIFESIRHGVTYTVLYNCWIYGVLLLAEYFKR